jgi:hypothetical protein
MTILRGGSFRDGLSTVHNVSRSIQSFPFALAHIYAEILGFEIRRVEVMAPGWHFQLFVRSGRQKGDRLNDCGAVLACLSGIIHIMTCFLVSPKGMRFFQH